MKKQGKKPEEVLINKKPFKLDEKIKKKTNHLLLYILLCRGWKTSKT